MKHPEENDPLDALLREQNRYTEDKGFTARVVKALPHRRRAWLRPVVLLSAAAIASVLAYLWLPWGNLPALEMSTLLSPDPHVMLTWATVIAVVWSIGRAVRMAFERE